MALHFAVVSNDEVTTYGLAIDLDAIGGANHDVVSLVVGLADRLRGAVIMHGRQGFSGFGGVSLDVAGDGFRSRWSSGIVRHAHKSSLRAGRHIVIMLSECFTVDITTLFGPRQVVASQVVHASP